MQIGEGLGKQWLASLSELPIIFVSKGCVCVPRKTNSPAGVRQSGVGAGQVLKGMVELFSGSTAMRL